MGQNTTTFPPRTHRERGRRLLLESVAGLADGEDMPRYRRIGFELAAQLGHVRVHGAALHRGAIAPYLGEELHAADDSPAASQQREQQVELLRGERDRPAAAQHGAGCGDDFHGAELLRLASGVSRWSGAPQQRLDARQELEHAERLCDVVVRAQTQPPNLVGFLAARSEDEDGHATSLVAQRAEHAVAVQARQHQIENDQVGPGVPGACQPLGPVLDDQDLVALDLEVVAQTEREIGVVLHHEDPCHALAPASTRTEPAPAAAWACGTSGSSITNRLPARPPRSAAGASSAQTRPPCSATSSRTTDRPMPVPATAEPRSRSSRQNRSQMRSRSAAGMPGPWSATHSSARPSVTLRLSVTVWPDGPYFTALSSRLRSIWRRASASTGATTPSVSSVHKVTPRAAASGANPSAASLTSGASGAGAGESRASRRSEREKCSRFSTRWVSRRASWSMISSERSRSSSERTRPRSRVSENMRIWASGVRSSCDTPDTKSARRRDNSYSRRSCSSAATTSPAVSASNESSIGTFDRGIPPITSLGARSGRSATCTRIA